MRLIYVKAYKVAGTTTASVFERMAVTHGWKQAPYWNEWEAAKLERYDCLFDHANFKQGGHFGGTKCYPPQYNRSSSMELCSGYQPWTMDSFVPRACDWCGGYQPWMDYYIPRAWRLVMVEEPVKCISSMYYFDNGYSQAVHPKGSKRGYFTRKNNDTSFADPSNAKEIKRREIFFRTFQTLSPLNHVQWHWMAEGTPDRTLDQVVEMLLNGAFLVGITERLDESLMLWRHFMGLFVEDILYYNRKTGLPHPKVSEWPQEHQSTVKQVWIN